MIRFIWAEDEDGRIGYQGALPWHLPADLKHFKELTSNHIIVMGRKTFKDEVDILEKTKIHHIFKSDTWMPELKYEDFKLVNSESHHPDENNKFDYDFLEYKRI